MSDADTIRTRREEWLAAFAAEDIPAMSDFVTEDHHAIPPNQAQRMGRDAAHEFWRQGFAAAKTVFSTRDHNLAVVGDLAIDRFSWDMQISPHDETSTLEDSGGCVWIWRRDSDGAWRVQTAIWNSDRAQPGLWSGG